MRDWQDEENDRRLNEIHSQQVGGFDDLWSMGCGVLAVIAVIFVIAGALDNWLGWGLTDFLWGLVYEVSGGVLGSPKD